MLEIKIYQITGLENQLAYQYRGYKEAMRKGIHEDKYACVYHGYTNAKDLEDVFLEFNTEYRSSYQGHSLSVSDVVEVLYDSENKLEGPYYCDKVGYQKLDSFDTKKCLEMKGVDTVLLEPGFPAVKTKIETDLPSLQRAIGDDGSYGLVEVSYPFDDENVVVVGNEEAKLIGMQGTREIEGMLYAGPIYILQDTGEDFAGLTKKQTETYFNLYRNPEMITEEELAMDCGFQIMEMN